MGEVLRVLVVEDSADDAEQLLREVRRAGYEPTWQRVETAEALRAALSERTWDAVVADYNLPSFSAPAALKIVRESGLDLPFVILSGVVSDEQAVAAMKAGAHDYIRKDNLARLIPAIAREVREARMRARSRRLEEALRQAQKMEVIGQFASGLAGEFNNVLTVITRHSAALLSELAEDTPMRGQVEEIHRSAERASLLTQQLLAFGRRTPLEAGRVNLNSVVRGVGEIIRHLAGDRVHLDMVLEPSLGCSRGDQSQMEQVLMNLVVNAREAMPNGGRITITTANLNLDDRYEHHYMPVQPGAFVMLEVSDTGCGMDEHTRARIFEPFFTTKPEGAGSGLGLSTVYGIVKQHGGDIQVRTAAGQGTTLRIYLPRAEEAAEPAALAAQSEARRVGAETVLLVDDEQKVRSAVREILEAGGYRVLEAADGAVALLVASRHSGPIHLLLTDVVMPDMSGLDLAGKLARLRPELKVLYMSSYTGVQYGILARGKAFLQKPVTPERLTHQVREVLDAPGYLPGE